MREGGKGEGERDREDRGEERQSEEREKTQGEERACESERERMNPWPRGRGTHYSSVFSQPPPCPLPAEGEQSLEGLRESVCVPVCTAGQLRESLGFTATSTPG